MLTVDFEQFPIAPGERVLDLGCGGGRHAFELYRRGAEVVACDYSLDELRQVATEAMRIHGGYGYTKEFPVERYYRDAPLMIIGEGTNEIQRIVIARGILARSRGDIPS